MTNHPIEGLMKTAMESLKDMVDVNTIIGNAVETQDGTVIIPISRVSFGFAAGGGDCMPGEENIAKHFGGGSGAGVSVKPAGFLISSPTSGVRFLPVEGSHAYDRIIDLIPQSLNKIQDICKEFSSVKQPGHEEHDKTIKEKNSHLEQEL